MARNGKVTSLNNNFINLIASIMTDDFFLRESLKVSFVDETTILLDSFETKRGVCIKEPDLYSVRDIHTKELFTFNTKELEIYLIKWILSGILKAESL